MHAPDLLVAKPTAATPLVCLPLSGNPCPEVPAQLICSGTDG